MQRLDDVLRNPIDPASSEAPAGALLPAPLRLQGAVELRQVTFGYSRGSPPLIDQLSVSLKPGQWVALVGASGSGKSTLARLVCGLYEPWEGTILFDGMPRSQIPRAVLTQSIALVDQELSFFAGMGRDNLTLWDTTVPESQLVQACQDATVHDTVLAMAGGYEESRKAPRTSAAVSANAWKSPVPYCTTRRWWSGMRRPVRSMRTPNSRLSGILPPTGLLVHYRGAPVEYYP